MRTYFYKVKNQNVVINTRGNIIELVFENNNSIRMSGQLTDAIERAKEEIENEEKKNQNNC